MPNQNTRMRHLRKSLIILAMATLVPLGGAQNRKEIRPGLLTDAYVPLVIVGEGWSQQIIVQNLDEEETVTGTLEFFTAQGDPWSVNLVEQGSGNTFFVTLLPGQTAIYETVARFEPQSLGYAHIDTDCCPRAAIQTVFRKQQSGRPDLMTSLAVGDEGLRSVRLFVDNRDGKFAGVGILNTDTCFSFSCESVLDITFRDAQGNVVMQDKKTQRHRTLWWFSLSAEYPQLVGRLGTLEVRSGDPESEFIGAVGFSLQFAPNGAFTAITSAEQ